MTKINLNGRARHKLPLLVFLFALLLGPQLGHATEIVLDPPMNNEGQNMVVGSSPIWTVFVKKGFGIPRVQVFDEINRLHGVMAKKGWEFKNLFVYLENGDLQGVLVTYTRDSN